jgi:uncharacterized tellurite resistance protein B-like protein
MFDAIARFFAQPEIQPAAIDPKMAVAALLVHLANVDGVVTDDEQETIAGVLEDHFSLDPKAVTRLVEDARRKDADAVDFYQFTSTLSSLPEDERIGIIRMMWQVVFADDESHELEDNMVWRVAELIHVPARQRAILRGQMKR